MRFESLGPLEASFFTWRETKLLLEDSLGISTGSLHVIIGMMILLLAALLLRKSVASWRPWLVLLAFATLNEANDLRIDQWPNLRMQYAESVKDLLLTLFLPTLLLITARRMPQLYARRDRAAPKEDTPKGD